MWLMSTRAAPTIWGNVDQVGRNNDAEINLGRKRQYGWT
jgi:hypothetical protein